MAALVLAAGLSSAATETATSLNTFGILKIESAWTNTMVAVPWTWYSKTEAAAGQLPAYKLVKTTNLTAGDRLFAYVSDGHYAAWQVVGTADPKAWEPIATVWRRDGADTVTVQADGDDTVTTLPRAAGVWLVRQNPLDAEGKIRPFWIYGQSVEAAAETTIAPITDISDGKARPERSTTLGNPYAQAVKINDLVFEGTIGATDTIIVPNGTGAPKYLRYRDTGTKRKPTGKMMWVWENTVTVNGTLVTEKVLNVEIPPGLAFWYVRRGEGDLTVSWPLPEEE